MPYIKKLLIKFFITLFVLVILAQTILVSVIFLQLRAISLKKVNLDAVTTKLGEIVQKQELLEKKIDNLQSGQMRLQSQVNKLN